MPERGLSAEDMGLSPAEMELPKEEPDNAIKPSKEDPDSGPVDLSREAEEVQGPQSEDEIKYEANTHFANTRLEDVKITPRADGVTTDAEYRFNDGTVMINTGDTNAILTIPRTTLRKILMPDALALVSGGKSFDQLGDTVTVSVDLRTNFLGHASFAGERSPRGDIIYNSLYSSYNNIPRSHRSPRVYHEGKLGAREDKQIETAQTDDTAALEDGINSQITDNAPAETQEQPLTPTNDSSNDLGAVIEPNASAVDNPAPDTTAVEPETQPPQAPNENLQPQNAISAETAVPDSMEQGTDYRGELNYDFFQNLARMSKEVNGGQLAATFSDNSRFDSYREDQTLTLSSESARQLLGPDAMNRFPANDDHIRIKRDNGRLLLNYRDINESKYPGLERRLFLILSNYSNRAKA